MQSKNDIELREHWPREHERVLEVCDELECFYSIDVFLIRCERLPREPSRSLSVGETSLLYVDASGLIEFSSGKVEFVFLNVGKGILQLINIRVITSEPIAPEEMTQLREKALKALSSICARE
ncbi:MAG: hypothetical protein QXU97_01975 [Fervidicoccaceae archaeon]